MTSEPKPINPTIDLAPLCPNCHAMVHLGGKVRTINFVRKLLGKEPIPYGD